MATWRLDIEYDGTRYNGWQKQPNARTVQGELIKAAENLLKTNVEIGGSGRTDSGVHALHQVAHLKIKTQAKPLSVKQLQFGLNDGLPADIQVLKVQPAAPNFHARHEAVSRFYIYQISTRRTAFSKPYVWWIKDRLNLKAMQECCNSLVGRHDFRSFSEENEAQASTIVHVETCYLFTSGSLILIRIGASHFLWKMVRRIVGATVEVGRGNLSVRDFQNFLDAPSREPAAWTAPPSGLFLERVLYSGDAPPENLNPVFPVL